MWLALPEVLGVEAAQAGRRAAEVRVGGVEACRGGPATTLAVQRHLPARR
jgi:hypothetical protein